MPLFRKRHDNRQAFPVTKRKRIFRRLDEDRVTPEIFAGDIGEHVAQTKREPTQPAEKEFLQATPFNMEDFKRVVRFFLSRGFRPPTEKEFKQMGMNTQGAQEGLSDYDEYERGIVVFTMTKPSGGRLITAYVGTDKDSIVYGISYGAMTNAAVNAENKLIESQRARERAGNPIATFDNYDKFRQEMRDIAIQYDNEVVNWQRRNNGN